MPISRRARRGTRQAAYENCLSQSGNVAGCSRGRVVCGRVLQARVRTHSRSCRHPCNPVPPRNVSACAVAHYARLGTQAKRRPNLPVRLRSELGFFLFLTPPRSFSLRRKDFHRRLDCLKYSTLGGWGACSPTPILTFCRKFPGETVVEGVMS